MVLEAFIDALKYFNDLWFLLLIVVGVVIGLILGIIPGLGGLIPCSGATAASVNSASVASSVVKRARSARQRTHSVKCARYRSSAFAAVRDVSEGQVIRLSSPYL